MVTRIPQSKHGHPRRHAWWSLHLWQRVVVVAVVLGALVISAGLTYYEPRIQTATPAARATSAAITTLRPAPLPGTDPWYYWGQSQPLDQQP
jgi:hypothetical protein